MARTFKKRGLRRDLNFQDIPTPETALNNMLGNIASQGETGDRFISQDLDVIRGLRRTTMARGDFLNIDGAAPTVINQTTGIEEVYKPIITLQNRFDQARFTIGEPQFFGGNGLTARYFEQDDVTHAISTTSPSTLGGVTSNGDAITFQDADGNDVTAEVFWEQGQYTFIGNLKDDLSDVYGGITWNGWFKPTRGGKWRWSIGTTGLFAFQFNTGANAVSGPGSVEFARLRPVIPVTCDFVNGSATVTVTSGNQNGIAAIRHIGEGDIVWANSLGQLSDKDNLVTVTDVDYDNNTFEMSAAATFPNAVSQTAYIAHPFGESSSWTELTGNLSEYEYYPITITYFWKDAAYTLTGSDIGDLNITNGGEYYFTADSSLLNSLSVNVTPPNSSSAYTNYKYLYDEDYERNPTGLDKGDFFSYYENRVYPGGTRITNSDYQDGAIGDSSDAANYENVFTKGQLVLPYEPPKNFNDIIYSKTMNYEGGSIILTTGNTDGIEVGNIVIPTTGSLKTSDVVYVTEVSINEAVFLSEAVAGSSSGSETYYFIDHRGLKWLDTTTSFISGGLQVGLVNTTADVEVGDVVINAGVTSTGNWNTVSNVSSPNSFNASFNFTQNSSSSPSINQYTFLYERAGLKNDSLDTYCNGVHGMTTVDNPADSDGVYSAGETQIIVTNPTLYDGVPGAANINDFTGDFVFFGDRIPDGTTGSITGSGPNYTLTLSNGLTDDINGDQVLVFFASNENKDLCFPPTDTSPPFTATVNGLQTTSSRPTIEITGTDSEVKFIRLFVENGIVSTASSDPAYDTKIPIKDLTGTTYNILADEV